MRYMLMAFSCGLHLAALAHAMPVQHHDAPLPPEAVLRLGTTRFLHPEGYTCLAYSPDGGTIATAGWGREVRICDAETGRLLRTLEEPSRTVYSLAFSPDGATLATASRDGSIGLWDLELGEQIRRAKAHDGYVSAVAFSPDGELLASGGQDLIVIIWGVTPWTKRETLSGLRTRLTAKRGAKNRQMGMLGDGVGSSRDNDESAVDDIAFSPSGHMLGAVGSVGAAGGDTVVWNVVTGAETVSFKRPRIGARALAFSPDGKKLATGGFGEVAITDVSTWNEASLLEGFEGSAATLAFSPSGESLACSSDCRSGCEVSVWDQHWRRRSVGKKSWGRARAVAFSPNGATLAYMLGSSRAIATSRVGANHDPMDRGGHSEHVDVLCYSPDGSRLASGGMDHTIVVWDTSTGQAEHWLDTHVDGEVTALAFSSNGATLVGGLNGETSGRSPIWDVTTGDELDSPWKRNPWKLRKDLPEERAGKFTPISQSHLYCLALSPDDRYLVTGHGEWSLQFGWCLQMGGQNSTCVWDLAGETLAHVFTEHDASVESISFIPGGDTVLTTTYKEARFVSFPSGDSLRSIHPPGTSSVNGAAVSPDGHTCAIAFSDKSTRLYDVATGSELASIPVHSTEHRFTFSPDGSTIAFAENAGAEIWDVGTRKRLRQLEGHRGYATSIAFSPDGRFLATGGSDTSILIWDIDRRGSE